MTKPTAILTAACLALSLAACTSPVDTSPTSAPATSTTPVPSTTAGPDDVVVDRDPQGLLPTISFDADGIPTMATVTADPPTVISVKTLQPGSGATIGANDLVTIDFAGFLWSDGSEFDSSFGTGEPASFLLSNELDGWTYGLAGTKVGDRVLLVVPPEYGYDDTAEIPADSTLVFLIDVLDTVPITTDALTQAEPTGATLPVGVTVEGALGTQPTLRFEPGAPEPSEAQTIVLAKGSGPEITENDTLLYHMTGGSWLAETSSTWADGIELMEGGGTEETLGQTVGSRLLLLYPTDPEAGLDAEAVVLDLVAVIPE